MSSDALRKIVINQDENKQKTLNLFSDNHAQTILSAVMEEPKSALEITDETKNIADYCL